MNSRRLVVIVGVVTTVILLFIASCAVNRQPSITSLVGEAPGWTSPLGSLDVTCSATDLDGEALSYSWATEGGEISGTGPEVIWTAPEDVGMYDITVVVDDGHGGEATASVALIASNGPPPTIDDIVVTANHTYLKETATGYKVAQEYDYNVECLASNVSGELIYQWSCTDGEISGEGSIITWTAPNIAGLETVTAKAFDSLGNWVRKSVLLEVVPCSSCEFG